MPYFICSILITISLAFLPALAGEAVKTPLEHNNYQTLPRSAEISAFLQILAKNSHNNAKIVTLGQSVGGRAIEAVLISTDPRFLQTGQPTKNKLTVMLIGSQHGTEESGTEALQMIVRDILTSSKKELLNTMNLVGVVNANPDGRDNSSRFNENGGNINIDYLELEEDETLVLVDALWKYQPHIILDLHEASANKKILTREQGYITNFESQFAVNNNPNIAAPLNKFANEVFLPEVIQTNVEMGVPARPYQGEILCLQQPLTHASLRLWNFRNYSAMNGSISMLVENKLNPRQGNYTSPGNIQERVRKQKVSVEAFLAIAGKYKDEILTLTTEAREYWTSHPKGEEQILLLQYERELDTRQPEYDIELINVQTGNTEIHPFPNFAQVKTALPLALPVAYVITDEQQRFQELLTRHHLAYRVIKESQTVKVVQPFIRRIEVQKNINGYSDRLKVSTEESTIELQLQAGDLWVPVKQPFGQFIPLILDPRSSDSIFQTLAYRPLLLKNKAFFISRVEKTEK